MSTALERALTSAVSRRAAALAALPEDQFFDRKSARVHPRDLAEALIGFANAEGGTVVIGLHDGRSEDAAADPRRLNGWRQAALDFTVPPVATQLRLVEWSGAGGRSGSFAVIDVTTSHQVHATVRDEVFLRVGDSNRRLTFAQRQQLLYDKSQAEFEASTMPEWSYDDLDPTPLERYAKRVRSRDVRRLLTGRGLLDRSGQPTAGAVLLFGVEPQRAFPNAYLRVLRYQGRERGVGARLQVLDDRSLEGTLPQQIGAARRVVGRWIPSRTALREDGLFGPVDALPRDVWLEAVVNAVIHRAYDLGGDHIRVEIFDDRMEVHSPGRFPGVTEVRDPLEIPHFARNHRVARVCRELGFGRELGEGIRRMAAGMRDAGLAPPTIRQYAAGAVVTLSFEALDALLAREFTPDVAALVAEIRSAEQIRTGHLVEASGRSRPWVIKQLEALERAGVAERIGQGPTDPNAIWQLRQPPATATLD